MGISRLLLLGRRQSATTGVSDERRTAFSHPKKRKKCVVVAPGATDDNFLPLTTCSFFPSFSLGEKLRDKKKSWEKGKRERKTILFSFLARNFLISPCCYYYYTFHPFFFVLRVCGVARGILPPFSLSPFGRPNLLLHPST